MEDKNIRTESFTALDGTPNISELSEDELVLQINSEISENESKLDMFRKRRAIAKKYYKGDQIEVLKLNENDPEVVVNRIFSSIEHAVSLTTEVTPLPWIDVTPKNKAGRLLKDKLERKLRDEWEVGQNMQKRTEELARGRRYTGIAFAKVWRDERDNRNRTKIVPFENLVFDPEIIDFEEDANSIAEFKEDTLYNLIQQFPDKEERIMQSVGGSAGLRSKVRYLEYYGRYLDNGKYKIYRCWKYKDIILDIEYNINWNENVKDNQFSKPMFPYIPYTVLSDGESFIDSTTETEQAIPLQDSINRRKRQIDKNAKLAEGKYVVSALGMSEEAAHKIPTSDVIFLSDDVENIDAAFRVHNGRALESGVYQDYIDSKSEIDNIMGVHAATRGERTGTDAASRTHSLKESDRDRLDPETRSINEFAEMWFKWQLQLWKVYLKDGEPIISPTRFVNPKDKYLNEQGLRVLPRTQNEYELTKKDFKDLKVTIIVKRNAVPPRDPMSLRNDAVTLRQTGLMNPKTFYELYGVENHEEHARNEYLWNSNPAALWPELGGNEVIHPLAIDHIIRINAQDPEPETLLLDSIDPEEHAKYVQTLTIYVSTGEIGNDIENFHELPTALQITHRRHLEDSLGRLQEIIKLEQDKAQNFIGTQTTDMMGGMQQPVDPAMQQGGGMQLPV